MFNLTLFSFAISRISNSPFVSLSSSNSYQLVKLDRLQANNFAHHFLYVNSKPIPATIAHSSFHGFLKSPLVFENTGHTYDKRNFTEHLDPITSDKYLKGDKVTITDSDFKSCNANNGGAVFMALPEGILIIHRTNFHECTSTNNGGAVFAAAKSDATQTTLMKLEDAQQFYSHFCCYSNCGCTNYGSATMVAANSLQLNYSATFDCPANSEKATGAQFDLQSQNYIGSNYINATTGNSRFCAGMEYRFAKSGYFRYQTVVNQKGAFITSFTDLEIKEIQISECNFVNETIICITGEKSPPKSGVLHIRLKPIVISNFCFVNIQNQAGDKFNLVSKGLDKSSGFTITLNDCFIDNKIDDKYFTEITQSNNQKQPNDKITTHVIIQLKLGNCQGILVPPPINETIQLPTFTEQPPTQPPTEPPTEPPTPEPAQSEVPVVPPPENDQGEGDSSSGLGGAAIGGIVAGGAAVVAVGAVAAYFVRNRLKPTPEGLQELETEGTATNTQNPLYKQNGADDPFHDDFEDNAL